MQFIKLVSVLGHNEHILLFTPLYLLAGLVCDFWLPKGLTMGQKPGAGVLTPPRRDTFATDDLIHTIFLKMSKNLQNNVMNVDRYEIDLCRWMLLYS